VLGQESGPPLAGTKPLALTGDIASELVAGVDRFLSRQIDASIERRGQHWRRDFSTAATYAASVAPNRARLAHMLGVRDIPSKFETDVHYGAPLLEVDSDAPYSVRTIRWPAFGDVTGEGLEASAKKPRSAVCVIVIPDADQTPEQLFGLAPGVARESQAARRLAEMGYRVVVPTLISRAVRPRNGRAKLTNREFVYRPAFELGRHIIGYEVQKVVALVDLLARGKGDPNSPATLPAPKIAVFGFGEGGGIALYASALEPRIAATCVSGYFDDRNDVWRQPIDRNVFGLLDEFGDAELASLIAPRPLVVEAARGPEVVIPPGTGGAPGRLTTPKLATVQAEVERARALLSPWKDAPIELVTSGADGTGPFASQPAIQKLIATLGAQPTETHKESPADHRQEPQPISTALAAQIQRRQDRQLHELDRHSQQLLVESAEVRREFFKKLDTSSLDNFARTIEPYRTHFAQEVIGAFDTPLLAPNVRSRRVYDEPKLTGYEVVMDVFPDVIAYGILLMPKGIKPGEKRPVVVCQHGLEGRPTDAADPKVDSPYYHRFAVKLAEAGFITFSPQNLYIFGDRFRTLQRKANPIKKTLFSVIVPQHQQITEWLKQLPEVDPARIAFYGLSYGGKSAMRIPPLVKNYCLSICSADFNEWVWKNASTHSPYSYVWTPEYEIFEFDLGSTFNYAEMAALIAPRPFMVERGHFDGVSSDEAVAYEFAKVFHLYDAKLHIGDRCKIEVFVGPHTINGKGTFAFLRKHLDWNAER
jgi:dienelactone hydrolase